jgi:hypothetical protein
VLCHRPSADKKKQRLIKVLADIKGLADLGYAVELKPITA